MLGFGLLWSTNVPEILETIFIRMLEPKDVVACMLVCKKWRDFIHETLSKPGVKEDILRRHLRHIWMRGPLSEVTLPADENRHVSCYGHGNSYFAVDNDGQVRGVTTGGVGYNEIRIKPEGKRLDFMRWANPKMLFTDEYVIVHRDGYGGAVYAKGSLRNLCVIDLIMVHEWFVKHDERTDQDDEEESDAVTEASQLIDIYELHVSHISAVRVVGSDVFVVAQVVEPDDDDIQLILFKLVHQKKASAEDDGSFALEKICGLKFDYEEVYAIHNVYAGGSPLLIHVIEDRILIVGCNDRELLVDFKEAGGKVLREGHVLRNIPDEERGDYDDVGCYSALFKDSYYGYIPTEVHSKVLLYDLRSGEKLAFDDGEMTTARRFAVAGETALAIFRRETDDTYTCDIFEVKDSRLTRIRTIAETFLTGAFVGGSSGFLALLNNHGHVKVIDVQTGEERKVFEMPRKEADSKEGSASIHKTLRAVGSCGLTVRLPDKSVKLFTFGGECNGPTPSTSGMSTA